MTPRPAGSRQLLAVLGAVNQETTVFENALARPGEEVPVLGVEEAPVGKGANVAVAATLSAGEAWPGH